MVRSTLDKLANGWHITLHILDCGISTRCKERLLDSWHDERLHDSWHQVDLGLLRKHPLQGHFSAANLARLLAAQLLPDTVAKVIYYDANVFVCDDISTLWMEPFAGSICLAIQEASCPWMQREPSSASGTDGPTECDPPTAPTMPVVAAVDDRLSRAVQLHRSIDPAAEQLLNDKLDCPSAAASWPAGTGVTAQQKARSRWWPRPPSSHDTPQLCSVTRLTRKRWSDTKSSKTLRKSLRHSLLAKAQVPSRSACSAHTPVGARAVSRRGRAG